MKQKKVDLILQGQIYTQFYTSSFHSINLWGQVSSGPSDSYDVEILNTGHYVKLPFLGDWLLLNVIHTCRRLSTSADVEADTSTFSVAWEFCVMIEFGINAHSNVSMKHKTADIEKFLFFPSWNLLHSEQMLVWINGVQYLHQWKHESVLPRFHLLCSFTAFMKVRAPLTTVSLPRPIRDTNALGLFPMCFAAFLCWKNSRSNK